jgi:hypothetical protein
MTTKQQGVQDVITIGIILATVGFAVQGKLSALVSVVTFNWIMLILTVILLLAYFADVLFFGVTPTIPTVPPSLVSSAWNVPVSQNLPQGSVIVPSVGNMTATTEIPANMSTTSTETTLQPPTV